MEQGMYQIDSNGLVRGKFISNSTSIPSFETYWQNQSPKQYLMGFLSEGCSLCWSSGDRIVEAKRIWSIEVLESISYGWPPTCRILNGGLCRSQENNK